MRDLSFKAGTFWTVQEKDYVHLWKQAFCNATPVQTPTCRSLEPLENETPSLSLWGPRISNTAFSPREKSPVTDFSHSFLHL